MRMPLKPELLNRSGVVHGGMICTLLDAAAGYAGLYAAPDSPARHGVTLSLSSNFLAYGLGKALTVKGYAEKKGGPIYFSRLPPVRKSPAIV